MIFSLNIIIVSSDFLPEKSGRESFLESEFFRILDENKKMRLSLARDFSSLGANVLIIEPDFSGEKSTCSMEFKEQDGISRVLVHIDSKRQNRIFPVKDILRFSGKVLDNSACIGGIFLPDIVISSGSFPFSFGAAEKIAEESSAVLITELFCSENALIKTGATKKMNPVLTLLKKAEKSVLSESDAVLSFFPGAKKASFGAHGVIPMDIPSFKPKNSISPEGLSLYEKVFAFKEGKNFVLASFVPLENGFSIEELILASKEFEGRLSLVFISSGSKARFYKSFIAERGIKNVFFLDEPPEDEISFVLSGADGVFVSENTSLGESAPQQSRFYRAFSAGKPVLAASENFLDFLRKSGGAVISRPKNKESLRLGIKALLEMSETDRETLSRSGKDFFDKNSAENFSKEYFSLLKHLVKQKENKK